MRQKSVDARPHSVVLEEEGSADMWGPHVSDREERWWWCPKAHTHEGNVFRWGAKGAWVYRTGWVSWRPGKGVWADMGELGRLGQIEERNQLEI
jgi:hypothetical protein